MNWHHQMATFSKLLALCEGNSPVTGGFPSQRPVRWSFDVFFWSASKQMAEQIINMPLIQDTILLITHHCNGWRHNTLKTLQVSAMTSEQLNNIKTMLIYFCFVFTSQDIGKSLLTVSVTDTTVKYKQITSCHNKGFSPIIAMSDTLYLLTHWGRVRHMWFVIIISFILCMQFTSRYYIATHGNKLQKGLIFCAWIACDHIIAKVHFNMIHKAY